MNYPYCQKELIEGYIYGDRYSLKWLPADKFVFRSGNWLKKYYLMWIIL
ncbi:PF20097 family protein [Alkaliphilus metalliredigens]